MLSGPQYERQAARDASPSDAGRAARHTRKDGAGRAQAADESASGSAALQEADEAPSWQRVTERQADTGQQQSGESMPRLADIDPPERFDQTGLIDELAPLAENDGLFEVLLPDGETVSVAVTTSSARVRFLLSTTSAGLGAQLRRRRMELEQHLGRRIGRDVALAVL